MEDRKPMLPNPGQMEEIAAYASSCLAVAGLTDWTFIWDWAKRRLGSCRYMQKQITLSRHFVAHNTDRLDQIHDTVLHEIAHALAWEHHQEKGHGRYWKHFCRQLGANPRASAPAHSVESSPYRYHVRLRDTGEVVGYYYRRPRFARYIKKMMIKGRPETKGMLELISIA